MEKIIDWLKNIERLSGNVYKQAAVCFKDDPTLGEFLECLADQETDHVRIMDEALHYVKNHHISLQPVLIDDEVKAEIAGLFDEVLRRITAQTITREQLYQDIVAIERAEFNDVFLYLINTLKELSNDFACAAMALQNHQRFIKSYFYNLELNELNDRLRVLPRVWQEKILIVDDEDTIRTLIMALLNEEGVVDSANNGEEALKKLKHSYYKLIISDINMAAMDGIAFCRQAIHLFPSIRKRFLFFSGKFTPENFSFIKEQELRFMTKPAPIKEIRKNALAILLDQ